ncbi:MAG: lipopolysaccharide/colanic/teichoic acid biosynthesis glycosyltransferase [Planctomycetota bacterium]|jgi:lipopolysaccharide/colanic/teichoic acid biosynthesis glycosyltransferase
MHIPTLKPSATHYISGTSESPQTAEPTPQEAVERTALSILAEYQARVDWVALTPRSTYARIGQRVLELCVLTLAAPIALPIGALVWIANSIGSRSLRDAFFVQPRIGHRGRVFSILKFRTMSPAPASDMDSWSTGGDQMRVTRFGRLLRNSHLDELPQLINVLRGEMHLIGPRPEMVEVEAWACEKVAGFSERLAIRPGITGYAQITQGYTGRDVGCYEKKLQLCREYQNRISLKTDLGLVLGTVVWMLRGRGWKWKGGGDSGRPESMVGGSTAGAVETGAKGKRVA